MQAKRVQERLALKKIGLELKESAVEYLVVRHLFSTTAPTPFLPALLDYPAGV